MFRIKLKKNLNKRLMIGTITRETKREGQRKAKRNTTCMNPKKGKEPVPLMVRSYFTHSPSNVPCMQILKWVIVVDEASLRYGVLLRFPSLPLLHTTK
jgi:hypothetical protein